jgi:hypothetical protein
LSSKYRKIIHTSSHKKTHFDVKFQRIEFCGNKKQRETKIIAANKNESQRTELSLNLNKLLKTLPSQKFNKQLKLQAKLERMLSNIVN